jgi:hypothetical protein
MENHEMLLNSGFSSALPSLILPYLEKATYRRKTIHAFCGEDAVSRRVERGFLGAKQRESAG